jgi:hypothetical protein
MTTDSAPPIRLEVDPRSPAPGSSYDRRGIILRPVMILPAYFLLALFVTPWLYPPHSRFDWIWLAMTGLGPGFLGALVLGTGAMIAFRGRYPRWWFDAHAELVRFGLRFLAYALLITDRYPSTDSETDVRVSFEVPPVDSPRDRRIALFKPLLALPHILLFLVGLAFAIWAAVFAWLAALFGMRLPGKHVERVTGVLQYGLVIYGYAFLHLTDRYPRLSDGPTAPR